MRAVACKYLRDPGKSKIYTCVVCGSVVVEPGRNCGPGLCLDYEDEAKLRGGCRPKEESPKGDRDEPRG